MSNRKRNYIIFKSSPLRHRHQRDRRHRSSKSKYIRQEHEKHRSSRSGSPSRHRHKRKSEKMLGKNLRKNLRRVLRHLKKQNLYDNLHLPPAVVNTAENRHEKENKVYDLAPPPASQPVPGEKTSLHSPISPQEVLEGENEVAVNLTKKIVETELKSNKFAKLKDVFKKLMGNSAVGFRATLKFFGSSFVDMLSFFKDIFLRFFKGISSLTLSSSTSYRVLKVLIVLLVVGIVLALYGTPDLTGLNLNELTHWVFTAAGKTGTETLTWLKSTQLLITEALRKYGESLIKYHPAALVEWLIKWLESAIIPPFLLQAAHEPSSALSTQLSAAALTNLNEVTKSVQVTSNFSLISSFFLANEPVKIQTQLFANPAMFTNYILKLGRQYLPAIASSVLVAATANLFNALSPATSPTVSATKYSPAVSATKDSPAVSKTKDSPAFSETKHSPAVSETKHSPAVSETKDFPAVSETKHSPTVSETKHSPAVSETKDPTSFEEAKTKLISTLKEAVANIAEAVDDAYHNPKKESIANTEKAVHDDYFNPTKSTSSTSLASTSTDIPASSALSFPASSYDNYVKGVKDVSILGEALEVLASTPTSTLKDKLYAAIIYHYIELGIPDVAACLEDIIAMSKADDNVIFYYLKNYKKFKKTIRDGYGIYIKSTKPGILRYDKYRGILITEYNKVVKAILQASSLAKSEGIATAFLSPTDAKYTALPAPTDAKYTALPAPTSSSLATASSTKPGISPIAAAALNAEKAAGDFANYAKVLENNYQRTLTIRDKFKSYFFNQALGSDILDLAFCKKILALFLQENDSVLQDYISNPEKLKQEILRFFYDGWYDYIMSINTGPLTGGMSQFNIGYSNIYNAIKFAHNLSK